MRQVHAFTLLEVLAAVVIFTSIIGVLFSVDAALQRTNRFRDDSIILTRSLSYAFEPVVRSLRTADASEVIKTPDGCLKVRGFYGLDAAEQPVASRSDTIVQTDRVATVHAEAYFDEVQGSRKRWVKRVYAVLERENETVLTETRYIVPSGSEFAWPRPLNSCSHPASAIWRQDGNPTVLTSEGANVAELTFTLITPTPEAVQMQAPYAIVFLSLKSSLGRLERPLTAQTTITPTFAYGAQRD